MVQLDGGRRAVRKNMARLRELRLAKTAEAEVLAEDHPAVAFLRNVWALVLMKKFRCCFSRLVPPKGRSCQNA